MQNTKLIALAIIQVLNERHQEYSNAAEPTYYQ
jgi:hypothetical protein